MANDFEACREHLTRFREEHDVDDREEASLDYILLPSPPPDDN